MRVLGVDPGIAITGYGIIDFVGNSFTHVAYGSIQTTSDTPPHLRLCKLYNELTELIDKYHPQCLAVEELFFNRNVRTAMMVGQARGVIILAAAKSGLDVYEYTPLQVKQAVVGQGRADKRQVQFMIKIILQLPAIPRPDDVADALAIAVCHVNMYNPSYMPKNT